MSTSPRPTALVTGATAGIGAEFARQLAQRGHDLVLVARDRARLETIAAELADRFGASSEVLVADLHDRDALARVEARLADTERPVDYLVNNAGYGLNEEFDENPVDDEVRMLDLLVTVPLRLTHAALQQMLPRRSGTVLTVASVAGFVPLGTYSAAKAWTLSFTRWANAYYRGTGVSVSAVAPGFVRTEFHERMGATRESMAPNAMWLNPEPVVAAALNAADRGHAVTVPSLRYKLIVAAAVALAPAVGALVARRGRQRRASRATQTPRG